jgi:hypothetical protein
MAVAGLAGAPPPLAGLAVLVGSTDDGSDGFPRCVSITTLKPSAAAATALIPTSSHRGRRTASGDRETP